MKQEFESNTFTLALEILFGCSFSCNGCQANTTVKEIPTEKEFEKLFELTSGIGKTQWLQEIELAPTDFMTSYNRKEVVNNKGLQKLFTIFDNIELNTTLLYPRRESYQEMAENIRTLNPSGGLGLITPVDIRHIKNEKYINSFRTHLQWLLDELGPVPDFEISFTVGFDQILAFSYRYNVEQLWEMYDSFMRSNIHPNASFHFNISNTRGFLNNKQEVKDARTVVETLNRLYHLDLERHPTGWRVDSKTYHAPINPLLKKYHYAGNELYWSNGKCYHTPALYKNIEIEQELFLFNGETLDEYLADIQRLNVESLIAGAENAECQSCPHVIECSQKHTQLLSSLLGVKNSCVFNKKLG